MPAKSQYETSTVRSCGGPDGTAGAVGEAQVGPAHGLDLGGERGRGATAAEQPPATVAISTSAAIRIDPAYPGIVLALTLLVAAATAACPQNLANGLDTPATAKQLVTVEAKVARTTYATLRTWKRVERVLGRGRRRRTRRASGRTASPSNRREGDGTTPTGTFRIGRTMYGNEPNPGVRFRYRRLRCGDWWDEDPSSPTYNSFQHVRCGTKPPFGGGSEGMWQQPRPYPFLAVVEYNTQPVVPGRGSGIFLHAQTGGPTIGCISLQQGSAASRAPLAPPGGAPVIAIGTTAQLRS